jgi:outer membrane receptor protein involved in Fe transport
MLVSRPRFPFHVRKRTPVATAVLIALGSAQVLAQEQSQGQGQEEDTLGEVVVTAQKREENLQNVPISLQSLNSKSLEQLNVQGFKEYVQYLPTVSQQPSIGSGSGFNLVYMRGVATGGDGQATTSQPSVGTYLDEQPITTVQGNLDVHLYDIARVEALAGPQGTLYGASSQAGTIRIITNKPDPSGFKAGYSLEGNTIDGGGTGYVAEGFANFPLRDNVAIRIVGWQLRDAGWIDNIAGTRLYAGDISTTADDYLADNSALAKKNYNTVDTTGARAALRINLNDNWTVTPGVMWQKQDQKGSWGDDLSNFAPGNESVTHFRKEFTDDKWHQLGLTIEGALSQLDVTYSGNYLKRHVTGEFDYSDYSFWYDSAYATGSSAGTFANLFFDNNGNYINRTQSFTNDDRYSKQSHELRIATAQDKRVRVQAGLFYQKQKHDFYQQFGNMVGLADSMTMNYFEPGSQKFPGVVYLNSVDRIDTDRAIFGQIAFDVTERLELSVGARYFKPKTTVNGFFGYGLGFNPARVPGSSPNDAANEPGDPANGGSGFFSPDGFAWSRNGEWRCPSQVDYKDAPCQNVFKLVKESNHVGRVNVTYKATDKAMVYATWSEGYRPGGINRDPFNPDFKSDFLTNWEAGWKTRWMEDRVQINGAIFLEQWDKIQVAYQGDNGITTVKNGPKADIKGIEAQVDFLPIGGLRISTALAYYDSKLKDDYCPACNDDGSPWAPSGTKLPITAKFKGNVISRYSFPLAGFEGHVQGALSYEGKRSSDLNISDNAIKGDIPKNTFLDLAFGIDTERGLGIELSVQNATNEDAPLNVTAECAPDHCGIQSYGVRPRPRTIAIRFKQDF